MFADAPALCTALELPETISTMPLEFVLREVDQDHCDVAARTLWAAIRIEDHERRTEFAQNCFGG